MTEIADSTPDDRAAAALDADLRLGRHEAISELARIVLADETVETVLSKIAALGKRAISGADDVSVTLIRGERPRTAAYTGQLALDADELQYEDENGPCLDAAVGAQVMHIEDMRSDARWPRYAPQALAVGVRSSLSVPLPVQEDVIGALNVYSATPHAFDAASEQVAVTFAGAAAVTLANADMYASTAQLAEQMQAAMRSRAIIEQAKGVVMAQQGGDADAAFSELVLRSQRAGLKLRDIAVQVVESVQRPSG